MPTALPRLPVTLNEDQRALLDRLARLQGVSKSKILADLLDTAAPVLTRVADAIENVQQLDAEKRDAIRATIEDAQREAEQTAATALALLERIGAPMVAAQRAPQDPGPTVDLAAARRRHRRPPPSR